MIDYENMCEFDSATCKAVKTILEKEKNVVSRKSLLREVCQIIDINERTLRRIITDYFRYDLDFMVISSREGYIHSNDLELKKRECNEMIEYHINTAATIDDFAIARTHDDIVEKFTELKLRIEELQSVKTN